MSIVKHLRGVRFRVKSGHDVETLGLKEIWSEPTNIVAIEWPEKIRQILPERRIDVCLEYVLDHKRRIIVEGH